MMAYGRQLYFYFYFLHLQTTDDGLWSPTLLLLLLFTLANNWWWPMVANFTFTFTLYTCKQLMMAYGRQLYFYFYSLHLQTTDDGLLKVRKRSREFL